MAKAKSKPAAKGAGAGVRTPPAGNPTASMIGQIGLAEIRPSPLNPRKTFAGDSVAALAESVEQQGLLQPLVVRPIGDGKPAELVNGKWQHLSHFELIAGERRFRALQLLAEGDRLPSDRVPVNVRWLDDAQALAAMLVENDQREDVRPSEQAAGYKKLLDELGTLPAVAERTGKSLAFVRQVISLAKLPPWALVAVDAGELKRETAALVARVPGERARATAAACVLQGAHNPEWLVGTPEHPDLTGDLQTLTYRETKELIRTHFQVELKGAPFDRKALYVLPGCEPGHERSMPTCEVCPSRAGNDPEATAEGVRGDVCLNPDCFREKCEAHKAKVLTRYAKDHIEHDPDMDGARDLSKWCDPSQPVDMTGVLRPDELPSGDGRWKVKLSVLLSKAMPPRFVSFDEKGKPRVLARISDARNALVDLGVIKKAKAEPKAKPATKGADADLKPIEPVPMVRYRATLNELLLAPVPLVVEFEAPADRDPSDWYVREAAVGGLIDMIGRQLDSIPAAITVSKIDGPAEQAAAGDAVIDLAFRGTNLVDVPGFPAEAAGHLLTLGVSYAEQVLAMRDEIRTRRGRQNATLYDALREYKVPAEVLYPAGDALADHLEAKGPVAK